MTIKIGTLDHWLPHTHSALWQQISSLSKSTATQLLDSAAKAIVTANLTEYFVPVSTQHGTQLSHSVNVQIIFVLSLFYLTFLLHS